MASAVIVSVLTWLHIFSVVGWFGAAMVFLMVIEPSLSRLSPQANAELVLQVFPRFVRFIQVFATLTLLSGVFLALSITGGSTARFGFGSIWGLYVSLGAFFGVVTFLLVFFLLAPSVKSLGRLIIRIQQNPGHPPPPEVHRVEERLKRGAPAAVILLSLAMVFMVAAAGV